MGVSIRFHGITSFVSTHSLFACIMSWNLGLSTVSSSSLLACLTCGRVSDAVATFMSFGRETAFTETLNIDVEPHTREYFHDSPGSH